MIVEFAGELTQIDANNDEITLIIHDMGEPEDWGDEDCEKLIIPVKKGKIKCSKAFSEKYLKSFKKISRIRYGYHNDYSFTMNQICHRQSDGSLIIDVN